MPWTTWKEEEGKAMGGLLVLKDRATSVLSKERHKSWAKDKRMEDIKNRKLRSPPVNL